MIARDGVALTVSAGVARIVLDRPSVKNALDRPAWAALLAALDEARAAQPRVLTLSGAGGAFCAGGDLSSIEARLALPREERAAQLTADARAIERLVDFGCPTVAIVDGPAMGAGLSLALACDVRLASSRSRFSAAFCKIGLAGDFGVSWLLPRVVGRGRALDLLYSGEVLSAEDARSAGIVERVFPDFELAEAAAAYVARIAEGPASLPIIRRVVDAVAGAPLALALATEAGGQAEASKTADAKEGARAFLDKRPPRFTGQ